MVWICLHIPVFDPTHYSGSNIDKKSAYNYGADKFIPESTATG